MEAVRTGPLEPQSGWNKPVPPSVILVSPDLVPPSPPSGARANPIDAETAQAREGKHRKKAIVLD